MAQQTPTQHTHVEQIQDTVMRQNEQDISQSFQSPRPGLLDLPSELAFDFPSPLGSHLDSSFPEGTDFVRDELERSFLQDCNPRRSSVLSAQPQSLDGADASRPPRQGLYQAVPSPSTRPRASTHELKHSRTQSSPNRATTVNKDNFRSQRRSHGQFINFSLNEQGSGIRPPPLNDHEDVRTDSGYGAASSSRPQSSNSGMLDPIATRKNTMIAADFTLDTQWIQRLANINLRLHHDLLTVPVKRSGHLVNVNQNGKRTNLDFDIVEASRELAIDSTLQLSVEYISLVRESHSQQGQSQAGARFASSISQHTQLLLLSAYLALVQCYDSILLHIKAWTEVRLRMGTNFSLEEQPVGLPSLAIGSFKLPTSSPARPLVLACTIEDVLTQTREAIDQMLLPVGTRDVPARDITARRDPAGNHMPRGDAYLLGDVAKITLDAIRVKEAATMDLLQVIWGLALRCANP